MIQRSIPLFLLSWTAVAMAQAPEFAAPVRIEAGAKLLGENRLYPSPMLHDVNGDGLLDVVVGDLRGKITRCVRRATARRAMAANRRCSLRMAKSSTSRTGDASA
jgi:hypothetical protein